MKFGDCKIKTIKIEDEWFMPVHHIGISLCVSSYTLKGILRNHLPQEFSRKEINIDDSYDCSKLFTIIPVACRVILGSKEPDRHDVIDFFDERHNHLQDQAWKAQKTRHVALHDSIPTAKNYRDHICFVFKLDDPALLGSKEIAYEYACISRYPWHKKNGIKNFREKSGTLPLPFRIIFKHFSFYINSRIIQHQIKKDDRVY